MAQLHATAARCNCQRVIRAAAGVALLYSGPYRHTLQAAASGALALPGSHIASSGVHLVWVWSCSFTSIELMAYAQAALHSHGGRYLFVALSWICLQVAQNYLKQDQLFHTILHLPVVLTAVSSAVQDILQQEFGRSSLLIPNGIDCERFQPGPYQPLDGSGSTAEDSSNQALGTAAAVMTGPVTAAGASAAEDCSGSGQAMAEAPLGPGDGILSTDAPADAGAVGPDADAGVEGSAVMAAASSLELLAAAAAAVAEDAAEAAPMEVTELQPAAAADPTEAPAQDPQAATSYANDHQNPCMLVSLNPAGRMPAVQKKRVLLVGNPALPLKGFPAAIAALTAVSAVLPVKVRWVCQVRSFNAS